jgi:hypothetical protein
MELLCRIMQSAPNWAPRFCKLPHPQALLVPNQCGPLPDFCRFIQHLDDRSRKRCQHTDLGHLGKLGCRISGQPPMPAQNRLPDLRLWLALGHGQDSLADIVVILILFTSITLYVAAFIAAFGLHPIIEQYPINGAATNISVNAQLLLDNVMAAYDIAGNDFDANLAKLALQWGNHTTGQISELTVDEVTILASDGMVLGAQVAATTVPRLADYSTNVDPKIWKRYW